MNVFRAKVDFTGLQAKRSAGKVFARTLDRFVSRAAMELVREEKLQAPKAFSTLTHTITAEKNTTADYTVAPGANYAAAVAKGGKPHKPPLLPLYLWLKHKKKISNEKELRRRAYALRRYIEIHGTKANPFVTRSRIKMQGRIVSLIRQGIDAGVKEAYNP